MIASTVTYFLMPGARALPPPWADPSPAHGWSAAEAATSGPDAAAAVTAVRSFPAPVSATLPPVPRSSERLRVECKNPPRYTPGLKTERARERHDMTSISTATECSSGGTSLSSLELVVPIQRGATWRVQIARWAGVISCEWTRAVVSSDVSERRARRQCDRRPSPHRRMPSRSRRTISPCAPCRRYAAISVDL